MATIIVNATAARKGGAVSILNQFIENTTDSDIYYIFINKNFKPLKKNFNLKYIVIDTERWYKRLFWDLYGLKNWIYKNKLNKRIKLLISLQNTGIYYKGVNQIVYFHQLLSISKHKWRFYKSNEFSCFIYSKIYPFFIKKSINKNTKIIVQAEFIKKEFARKFKHPINNIYVCPPVLENDIKINTQFTTPDPNCISLIYPSNKLIYKNHKILIDALYYIKQHNNPILSKIKIYFTIKPKDSIYIFNEIKKKGLIENFCFIGTIPHSELLIKLNEMDALLFPSYIETIGLPLLEAAAYGLNILVSDLPYSRNIINDYSGAKFIKYNDAEDWATNILNIKKIKHEPYIPIIYNGWNNFFELIDTLK